MGISNLYHVISPVTNESVYFSPHFAEATQYAEEHNLADIKGDDGSIWQFTKYLDSRQGVYVSCWDRIDMEPLGEKLINWLDEQYKKLRVK